MKKERENSLMDKCQFCESTENLHRVGSIVLCQKCAEAIFLVLKKEVEKTKPEREVYHYVKQ